MKEKSRVTPPDVTLEISTFKSLSHFLSLYEFDNFYIPLRAEKDEKFSSHFVDL